MRDLPPPAPGVPPAIPARKPPGRDRWRVILAAAAGGALLVGLLGAWLGVALSDDGDDDSGAALDVSRVAEAVGPSVVTISADIDGSGGVGEAVGSGVVVDEDGEILTNAHVVVDATEIRVRLAGETEPIEAEVVATDVGNDLALLHVDADDLVPADFARDGGVDLGDEVVAIGFALDLDGEPSV